MLSTDFHKNISKINLNKKAILMYHNISMTFPVRFYTLLLMGIKPFF